MVDTAQYMNGTLDSVKQGTRGRCQIFSRTTRVSAMIEINNDVYGPTPDIAETSPRGHPDLRRGFPNTPHAGEAQWTFLPLRPHSCMSHDVFIMRTDQEGGGGGVGGGGRGQRGAKGKRGRSVEVILKRKMQFWSQNFPNAGLHEIENGPL